MSESKTLKQPEKEAAEEWKVGPGAWISLVIVLLVFSGFFFKVDGMAWLGAFDFTTLGGAFGTMKTPETNTFIGSGGLSAKAGFLCALAGANGDAGARPAGNIHPLRCDPCGA